MLGPQEELKGTSIILVGTFDLSAFRLPKLIESGQLVASDLAELNMTAVFDDMIAFDLPWMAVVAEKERIALVTRVKKPLGEPVRDFAVGMLSEMRDPKYRALGINTDFHFQVFDDQRRSAFLTNLAGKALNFSQKLGLSGAATQSVVVRHTRTDGLPGYIDIKIEPSKKVEKGIYMSINDHFALRPDADKAALSAIEVLSDQWKERISFADGLINSLKAEAGA
ncbi:MAG: hypothetical protein EPO55_21185 [Reyranella sp.]|uniref:hypothetical protein n=1 Tax=Reyranella sp. TaxID=1929291 RepID=UPI00120D27D5|nr:hypothetical protein [Reyranella sp.]TAJ36593.1 MAG: hypothetical protein EPO55_21185 [Reyranella sp.]